MSRSCSDRRLGPAALQQVLRGTIDERFLGRGVRIGSAGSGSTVQGAASSGLVLLLILLVLATGASTATAPVPVLVPLALGRRRRPRRRRIVAVGRVIILLGCHRRLAVDPVQVGWCRSGWLAVGVQRLDVAVGFVGRVGGAAGVLRSSPASVVDAFVRGVAVPINAIQLAIALPRLRLLLLLLLILLNAIRPRILKLTTLTCRRRRRCRLGGLVPVSATSASAPFVARARASLFAVASSVSTAASAATATTTFGVIAALVSLVRRRMVAAV